MHNTEDRDPRFADIDNWPTIAAVEAMLEEQIEGLMAIRTQTSAIASAAEAAADRLWNGGRLVYAGAGTSGRVAVQDGVELGPTFGWTRDRLAYLIAGGMDALAESAEGAEDDAAGGAAEVVQRGIGAADVVIGVAASGRTPFTLAIIEKAREAGALTIAIANNRGSALLEAAEHGLLAATGSEIIAGSTRMKAGTAQKAILNMLSTAIMLRLGRVYRGMMVDMQISNEKLLARAQAMIMTLADCPHERAAAALDLSRGKIKTAVLVARGDPLDIAEQRLAEHRGILRSVIEEQGRGPE